MINDAELLRRYTEENSDAEFTELVRRHLGLVYHAALRQCGGDRHRAEDVTQLVFIALARKARALSRRSSLAGWLYTSTRYAAVQSMRAVRRRERREHEVQLMSEVLSDPDPVVDWDRLRPVIDDVLFELTEPDREAVLLRFFAGCSFAEVGRELRVTEDAARVRVNRSVEKMQRLLGRRGITSTSAALGLAFANQACASVPAGLIVGVAGAAVSARGSGGTSDAFSYLDMTKIKIGILVAMAGCGAMTWIVNWRGDVRREKEISASAAMEPRALVQSGSLGVRTGSADSRVTGMSPAVSASLVSTDSGRSFSGTEQPAAVAPERVYRLAVGDRISCTVYQEPDLTTSQTIDRMGTGRFPDLGDVKLAGLTVQQAERAIEALYRERRILRTPVVSIVVTEFVPRETAITQK